MEKIIEGVFTLDNGKTGKLAIISTDENSVALKQAVLNYSKGASTIVTEIDNYTRVIMTDFGTDNWDNYDVIKHRMIKPKYDVIKEINDELQLISYNDEVGLYNSKSDNIIAISRNIELREFIDGISVIKMNITGLTFKFNYIDVHGKFLLKRDVDYAYQFKNGYGVIYDDQEYNECSLVNMNGEIIFSGFDDIRPIINKYPVLEFINEDGEDERVENYLDLNKRKLLLSKNVDKCNQFVGDKAMYEDNGEVYEVNIYGNIMKL